MTGDKTKNNGRVALPWVCTLLPQEWLYIYEGESVSNQLNLFSAEIHLFIFFDVIAL